MCLKLDRRDNFGAIRADGQGRGTYTRGSPPPHKPPERVVPGVCSVADGYHGYHLAPGLPSRRDVRHPCRCIHSTHSMGTDFPSKIILRSIILFQAVINIYWPETEFHRLIVNTPNLQTALSKNNSQPSAIFGRFLSPLKDKIPQWGTLRPGNNNKDNSRSRRRKFRGLFLSIHLEETILLSFPLPYEQALIGLLRAVSHHKKVVCARGKKISRSP